MQEKSHLKQQFVVTHNLSKLIFPHYCTVGLQTHLLSKCCVHHNITCPCIFVKTCLSVGLLWTGQVFFLSPVQLYVGGSQQTAISWAVWCFQSNMITRYGLQHNSNVLPIHDFMLLLQSRWDLHSSGTLRNVLSAATICCVMTRKSAYLIYLPLA
jgi:hypothetical protein